MTSVTRSSTTNGAEIHPFRGSPETLRHMADSARDAAAEQAADRYRARDLATTPDTDALAELRKVMADNADVLASSGVLAYIARFAESRSADRYGVLVGVLLRVVGAVPPPVVLPPIIGGEVSLNMFQNVVGASGAGKGTTDKTAAAAVRLTLRGSRSIPTQPMIPLGTGEGINRTYARYEKGLGLRWLTDRALFGCRDIASVSALIARQGATLLPELLKAYMGEELGFANADKERRIILPVHSYRLCLSAGVQPDNGEVLLNDQAQRDGVPQRFIWTPVRPGLARARRTAGAQTMDPLAVEVPDFGVDPMRIADDEDDDADPYNPASRTLVPLGVAQSIAQEIIDADAVKDLDPFGRSADPLAGHRLLAQLKLAAALSILHGGTCVGLEDWQRAERLIAVSTAVAKVVTAESGAVAQRDAERRGQLDGHRLAAADDTRQIAAVRSLMDRIARFLAEQAEQTDWVPQNAVRKSLSSKLRLNFADAVTALLADGTIERRATERNGQQVIHYRLKAV